MSRILFAAGAFVVICRGTEPALSREHSPEAASNASQSSEMIPPCPPYLPSPGAPGVLVVFGPSSCVWLSGRQRKTDVPVGAAAATGKGRVIALAHDGFVARAADVPEYADWLRAAVRWVATTSAHPRRLRIAIITPSATERALRSDGFDVTTFHYPAVLASVDAVVAIGRRIAPEWIDPLTKFVEDGGGLILAETAWSWNGGGRSLLQHPANQLCARWGIVWTDGTCETPHPDGFRPAVGSPLTHALDAFNALCESGTPIDTRSAIITLETAIRYIPHDDPLLRPHLHTWLRQHFVEPPSVSRPVRMHETIRRLAISYTVRQAISQPPAEMRALPGIESFPGVANVVAARERHDRRLNLMEDGWISTGLYVPAGEPVRLELPAGAIAGDLRAQIGTHTDQLWHLEEWKRYPEIVTQFHLTNASATIASPFGGLLYLQRRGSNLPAVAHLTIHGALEAPWYRRGETSTDEWRRRRNAPAPWGELAGYRLILTLPSDRLRRIEDPAPILETWDRVLDACAELAARPRERSRLERIVPDVQISAGYMHSGYPIMTHADQYDVLTDHGAILRGTWGLFHEIGHNHQEPDWTFAGTGEVTVNLFTLYVLETVCGQPPFTGHPEVTPEAQRRLWQRYVAGGRKFEDWKQQPFLALGMYMQLRAAFGWEPFRHVFAEYRALPPADRPRSDDERRDQWLIRFSRAVGRNLRPFFHTWGVPTSDRAGAMIEALPPWMPDNWPPSLSLSPN